MGIQPTETEGANVLVTGRHGATGRRDLWEDVVESIPVESSVLVVTNRDTPEEWLARWRHHTGTIPTDLHFIAMGHPTRSTVGSERFTTREHGACTVRTVSNPSDLTAVGIAFEDVLSSRVSEGADAVVVIDSLTVLLQHSSPKRVFRFLHMLTDSVRTGGHTAYLHIDPSAHEDETVGTLGCLFDEVVPL